MDVLLFPSALSFELRIHKVCSKDFSKAHVGRHSENFVQKGAEFKMRSVNLAGARRLQDAIGLSVEAVFVG